MAARFEIFEDSTGEYCWRLVSSNGEVVAQSEGYTQKHSAKSGAEAAKRAASVAAVVDTT